MSTLTDSYRAKKSFLFGKSVVRHLPVFTGKAVSLLYKVSMGKVLRKNLLKKKAHSPQLSRVDGAYRLPALYQVCGKNPVYIPCRFHFGGLKFRVVDE